MIKKKAKSKEVKSAAPPFVPTFNFETVPERVAENAPVKVAEAKVFKTERTAPQISSILVSEAGQCQISFSKLMRYPKNWVVKHLSDTKLADIDVDLVDSINVPLISFLYEKHQEDPPFLQIQLPDFDIKILSIEPTTISFNISF